jgi:hypothetical protein
MNAHPDYPVRPGEPAMDRCTCGGVRYWHAPAPRGCDDCEECHEFVLDAEATANARTRFFAEVFADGDQTSERFRNSWVSLYEGDDAHGTLICAEIGMSPKMARDFVEALQFAREAQDEHGNATL